MMRRMITLVRSGPPETHDLGGDLARRSTCSVVILARWWERPARAFTELKSKIDKLGKRVTAL